MPRLAVKSDLVPLNMKVTRELRARLEAAAKRTGRSLTGEVGYCVECWLAMTERASELAERPPLDSWEVLGFVRGREPKSNARSGT